MSKRNLILIAIDDSQVMHLFERALSAGSFLVSIARDHISINKELQESSPALLIISNQFDMKNGMKIAAEVIERFPTLPVLIFMESATVENLVFAMQIGIRECLFPPLKIINISQSVERAIRYANRIGDWTRKEIKKTTTSLQQRIDELQRFDTIIQQIEDCIIILDDNHHIVLMNASARKVFGIQSGEKLSGMKYSGLINHREFDSLIQGNKDNSINRKEIIFNDGRIYSSICSPVQGIGKVVAMQDISYLRKIDRLKDEFVNTVSHDLRSPLTAILGYVDMLERIGPLTDQQQSFIQRVRNNIGSINDLINNLLIIGQIEAGNDVQNQEVALDGIIQLSIDTFDKLILEKRLKIIRGWPEIIPPIKGNSEQIRQMVNNLLGNAVKYTPEGGSIRITMESPKGQVLLCISDTGPGIPPADQAHIFEKFYRAGNVPLGMGGTGLGLAIVKSIVDQHKGRVWVESSLGKGSTFYIILPVYSQQ